jgi:prepilin-type N-terminal cleavage/methylation domain-containing protein
MSRTTPDKALKRATTQRHGFTLVELMVSVAVLSVMILGFSVVLSQSQRMVTGAQNVISNNANASAIAQVIRQDFAAMSKDGFLAIVAPGDDSYPPQIVFTATGRSTAASPDYSGRQSDAAIICYRIRNDRNHADAPTLLCRETHLLTGMGVWNPLTNDVTGSYLSFVAGFSRAQIAALLTTFADYASLPSVPADLAEMRETWPILATDCPVENFDVHWLHHDVTDDEWYGFEGTEDPVSHDSWTGTTLGVVTPTQSDATDEVEARHPVGANNYVAMWSHHNRENWPRAVRLRFTLGGEPFEIICPVRP